MVLLVLPPAFARGKGHGPKEHGPKDHKSKVSRKVKEKIREAKADELLPVIVQTTHDPDTGDLDRMKAKHGGKLKKRHAAIKGYSASIKASEIEALAEEPDVEVVSYDHHVTPFLDVAFKAVKADRAFVDTGGLDGSGVGIAVIDTGAFAHPDLHGPAGSSMMQIRPDGTPEPLNDPYGHGTHVAGIITGDGAASSDWMYFRKFRGLAPGAYVIAIRALEADGTGSTSDIIAGVDWAIENKNVFNIRVLNLSLGHPVFEPYSTDPLCRAVRAATEAGIVVVVAAGNDGAVGSGYGTVSSPANEPSVIAVGAMDDDETVAIEDDIVAWYSSRGPSLIDHVAKPDLVAPGSWIVSARSPGSFLDTNYHDLTLRYDNYMTNPTFPTADGDYFSMAGTSMAAPMVAATAALMIQQEPGLNPATVKARLMASAVKDTRLVFETGAGYLDVQAALTADGYAASAPSPNVMSAEDGEVYIEDTAQTWGSAWTLAAVFGPDKGSAAGIDLTEVDSTVTQTYGAIWGGKSGRLSIIDNNQLTDTGEIWSGEAFSILAADETVDKLGAIWGGDRRR